MAKPVEIRLKTLTPIWTGGVDQDCDRLHETGLLGSLRWWYEALVRGLGGHACDPTGDARCPDNDDGKRCVACELFGCTGWGRKFRIQVLGANANIVETALLNANTDFALRFFELRPLEAEERWLLVKAVEVAAKYGALGGKTTLKPQKRPKVGDDYGIVQWKDGSQFQKKSEIEKYLARSCWRNPQVEEPDLRWFFFVQGAFLWRRQINALIGLSEDGHPTVGHEDYHDFLRGRLGSPNTPAVSKKIFSFRADGGRIWGYARDEEMRDKVIEKVKALLGKGSHRAKTGEELLREL